ncbi:TadA family conjugal transfer-associated ATPase [Allokutzneria sp. NRRL B-24872]|uniref:TadA family conjugal transfer-associated ATPase n=1 Tax=Allokutzneria sp. NRRL B-24872 TaxID=1137961 RepID=UPI000A3D249E|nr:TadA family conjugal transfer-associated ATPase [Allokutzneria sp. NRRL B-24872]
MSEDLADRVRHRIAATTGPVTAGAVADAVRAEAGGVIGDATLLHTIRLLHQEFVGAGPLEPLLRDPATTDVLVAGPGKVWVDQGRGLREARVDLPDEESVRRLAQRLALAAGRRLDDAQPYVDGWLPECGAGGNVRLHAVLAPIAADGTCVSLRVLRPATHDLDALRRLKTFDREMTAVLKALVAARLAFLVVGNTGSGKTTLLAAMLGCVPADERIVSVEEAAELRPGHPHVVRLVARPPNVEGAGEIALRQLVRQALRMRPDRLVVGEVRGAEVCELLAALNTGHDGGAGTVHANSPADVPARMEALAALGGLSRDALHSQLSAAIQVVLHMKREPDGRRRLAAIGTLTRIDERARFVPAWQCGSGWSSGQSLLADLLRAREVNPPWSLPLSSSR